MMKYTWLKVCESNSWCNNCIFGSWSKKSAVVSSILQYYKNTHRKWKSDTQQEIQSQSPKQNRSCAYTVMTYHGHTLWHHQTGFKLLVVVFIKRYCTDRFLKYISADVFEMAQPCWKVYNLWMNCLEGQAQLNIVGKKYHRTISG